MTIVTFVLGLVLIAAGAGGLVASFDLLPTELGLLYACCGAILVSGGVVTVAIGVAVLRLEALTQMVHFAAAVEDLPDEAEVAEPRCMRTTIWRTSLTRRRPRWKPRRRRARRTPSNRRRSRRTRPPRNRPRRR